MLLPGAMAFSPDDTLVTFLASPDGTLRQALYALDVSTGERRVLFDAAGGGVRDETVSREEALRRERLRERGLGVTSYSWAETGRRLLVPLAGKLRVIDLDSRRETDIAVAPGAPPIDARFSPCGRFVAYVQDAELQVAECFGGAPKQLTGGARGTGRTNGLAEFVAQEEMARHEGFWWSPDSSHLAFEEVDETHIPEYRIVHQGKDAVGDAAQEDHRYPFAGAANAKVRLGVVSRDGGAPVWMDLGRAEYLARVQWFPDGSLVAQLLNREQTELRVVRFDVATGRGTTLVTETTGVWINLHAMLRPFKDAAGELAGGFLWASERSGFQHLELRAKDGRLVRALTSGEWMVEFVRAVDEQRGVVWFLGTKDGVTEKHLYSVSFAGGEAKRITEARGMHETVVDHGRKRFLDLHHAAGRPPSVTLRSLDDARALSVVHDAAGDPRIAELALVPPELVTLKSRDGETLHAAVYAPATGHGPRAAIVHVYGGPHVQRVSDGWDMTTDLRAQYLRQLGFVVLVVDNRGSARRGLAFEGAIRHRMGDVEVRDQEDGVRWLVAAGLADPKRVGVYGWSYGGYMALMCLARAPDTFRAAVSGAPVTDWGGYDTCYTERYMGMPDANADGYRASSVMTHARAIRGELMLVHGMLDENVHFRHTARLTNALNAARKRHDLLLLPDERHMPRDEAGRVYVEERMADFFGKALA